MSEKQEEPKVPTTRKKKTEGKKQSIQTKVSEDLSQYEDVDLPRKVTETADGVSVRTNGTKNGEVFPVYLHIFDRVRKGTGGSPFYRITEEGEAYLRKMFSIGITVKEVAGILGVAEGTLRNEYNRDAVARAREVGENEFLSNIRRQQVKIMNRGDARMAQWLGKNYLGQSDKVTVDGDIKTTTKVDMDYDQMMQVIAQMDTRPAPQFTPACLHEDEDESEKED